MDQIASTLGDAARWRIVELLAERPRSVGELAELVGLRQPQATKHLQTLAKAGLVTVFPLGQRRVYALETAPLQALARRLGELVGTAEAHQGERDVLARYQAAIDTESALADREHWADGRTFAFERLLPATRDVVWRHWVEPALLAAWWAPSSMTITECVLEPKPGGRAVLDYRDGDGQRYRSGGTVHLAHRGEHLVFDLSILDTAGAVSFVCHFDLTLAAARGGTSLSLNLRVTDTSVEAAPYIAGIETGWGQVLDNLTNTLTDEKEPQS